MFVIVAVELTLKIRTVKPDVVTDAVEQAAYTLVEPVTSAVAVMIGFCVNLDDRVKVTVKEATPPGFTFVV